MYERANIPFGVLFFDVDRFKDLNDSYGHAIGDKALQITAKALSVSIRPFDTIGRWGGEEFLGVFPNTNEASLWPIANRLCMLVRHSQVDLLQGSLRMTVSSGGTVVQKNDTADSILKRADRMMYKSKELGRDRVTIE